MKANLAMAAKTV